MKEGTLFEGTLSEDVVPGSLARRHLSNSRPCVSAISTPKPAVINGWGAGVLSPSRSPRTHIRLQRQPTPARLYPGFAQSLSGQFHRARPAQCHPTRRAGKTLPRDPLARNPPAWFHAFKAHQFWLVATLSALSLVLVVWLALAVVRSRENDRQKFRRAALVNLKTILADIRASGNRPSVLSAKLVMWQQQRRPRSGKSRMPRPARLSSPPGRESDKKTLAPCGPPCGTKLIARCTAANTPCPVTGHRVRTRRCRPWKFPAGRHFPRWLRATCCRFSFTFILVLSPLAAHADEAGDAYKRGDFVAAETSWRKTLDASPAEWTARHNLGLALAQQDSWAEAAAHWTSAFLLNPRSATTHWDLALGLQRSGMAPNELVELSRGKNRFKIARIASPGEWQIILIVAALLLAAAFIILLLQGYKRAGNWAKPTALFTSLLAMVLAASATFEPACLRRTGRYRGSAGLEGIHSPQHSHRRRHDPENFAALRGIDCRR